MILAGVVPCEGETDNQLLVELVLKLNGKETLGSELVSVRGFGGLLVVPQNIGRPPDCSVTACNPAGSPMFNNALPLTKSVTPTSVVVVPLVGVFELSVILPEQVPAPRPAVLMLTVRLAGVTFDDNEAVSQPEGQIPMATLP